jgi:hypothetical protein
MEAFLVLPGNNAENVLHFIPGVEIVHIIAKKRFNPVNRAEFNPRVESAPCNRPLSLQFLSGITMRNMCPHFYVVKGFSNMYIQGLSEHYLLDYNSTNIDKTMEGLFS